MLAPSLMSNRSSGGLGPSQTIYIMGSKRLQMRVAEFLGGPKHIESRYIPPPQRSPGVLTSSLEAGLGLLEKMHDAGKLPAGVAVERPGLGAALSGHGRGVGIRTPRLMTKLQWSREVVVSEGEDPRCCP